MRQTRGLGYAARHSLLWLVVLLFAACGGNDIEPARPVNANAPVLIISDRSSLMTELGLSASEYQAIEDAAQAWGDLHYFDEEYVATRPQSEQEKLKQQQKDYRDAASKTDKAAIRSTRADYVAAIDGWLEGLLSAKSYYAILILGGDDVIPYPILDNPANDHDPWILTDDLYGDTTHDAQTLIDYPIARIPDGRDKDLVLAQLSLRSPPTSAHYGLGNVNRHGAEKVAAIYGGETDFEWCEPETDVSFGDALRYTYFMLHGSDANTSVWWGEYTDPNKKVDPEGLKVANASNRGLVTSAACYGAYTIQKSPANSISLHFLKSGAWGFVGSTGTSYSANEPSNPEKFLERNSGRFYKLFFDQVVFGTPPMTAFYQTKRSYAEDAKIKAERKIMHEYVYYGLPRLTQPSTPVPNTPIPVPGATPVPPAAGAGSATVLLIDVSGSMSDFDPTGQAKIEAARAAAEDIVNMIEAENHVQGSVHQVALVTFATRAAIEQSLTTDLDRVRAAAARLSPQNNTNVAHGIRLSNLALDNATAQSRRLIFLLSDGVPTVLESGDKAGGSPGESYRAIKQEILDGPVNEAIAAGNCIYTIGFGDPTECSTYDDGTEICSIDEPFLRDIAQRTGCGEYYPAADAHELSKIYVQLRHQTLGTVVDQFSGQVGQGETTPRRPIQIPQGQSELHATLHWPGSRLDLILVDPSGRKIDAGYPGATIATYARIAYLIVSDPVPGLWQVAVHGAEVPELFEEYNAVFSVRPREGPPPSDATPFLVAFLVVLVASGALGGAILLSRRSENRRGAWQVHSPSSGSAGVQVTGLAGPGATVRGGRLRIGRDPAGELVLEDPRVSRRHAQIVQTSQGYVIEDLNSTNGTHVNGKRVSRQHLHYGDSIQVGNVHLTFWSRG